MTMLSRANTAWLPSNTPEANDRVILILYGNMGRYGGIQSIVVRLVRHYRSIGVAAYCVTGAKQPIKEIPITTVLQSKFSDTTVIDKALRLDGLSPSFIDILAMDPQSLARGYRLAALASRQSSKRIRLGLGIYHPRELFRETERAYVHWLNRILARLVGFEKISFMSEETKLTHATFLKDCLYDSPIVPVPIDKREYCWRPSATRSDKLAVVSVGRIVPAKGYNFGAPKIVHRLLAEGVSLHWDLYGWGTHERQLTEQIAAEGVDDVLCFNGGLELEEFDSVVSRYDLFIGMGSAALQAAQLGVPTICAIDSLADGCYGFFHEAPFGNLGDLNSQMKPKSIYDQIQRYAHMSSDKRRELSWNCRSATKDYEIDNYIDRVLGYKAFRLRWNHPIVMGFSSVYSWVFDDNVLRRAVRKLFGGPVGNE